MKNKIKSLIKTIKFRLKRLKRTKKLSPILTIFLIAAAMSFKTSSILNEKKIQNLETNFIAHTSSNSKIESRITGQDNSKNIATGEEKSNNSSRNLFYRIYKFIVSNSRLTLIIETSGTIYLNPRVQNGVIKPRYTNKIIHSRITTAEKKLEAVNKEIKELRMRELEAKTDLHNLDNWLNKKRSEIAEFRTEADAELEKIRKLYTQKSNDIAELEKNFNKIQLEINKKEKEAFKLQERVDALNSEATELEENKDSKQSLLENLTSKIENAQTQLESLTVKSNTDRLSEEEINRFFNFIIKEDSRNIRHYSVLRQHLRELLFLLEHERFVLSDSEIEKQLLEFKKESPYDEKGYKALKKELLKRQREDREWAIGIYRRLNRGKKDNNQSPPSN